jgi:hypothetical protein
MSYTRTLWDRAIAIIRPPNAGRALAIAGLALLIVPLGLARVLGQMPEPGRTAAYWCLAENATTKHAYYSEVRPAETGRGQRRFMQIERFLDAASGASGTAFSVTADSCHWFNNRTSAQISLSDTLAELAQRGVHFESIPLN